MAPFGTRTAIWAPAENSGKAAPSGRRNSKRLTPSAIGSLRVTRSGIIGGSVVTAAPSGSRRLPRHLGPVAAEGKGRKNIPPEPLRPVTARALWAVSPGSARDGMRLTGPSPKSFRRPCRLPTGPGVIGRRPRLVRSRAGGSVLLRESREPMTVHAPRRKNVEGPARHGAPFRPLYRLEQAGKSCSASRSSPSP